MHITLPQHIRVPYPDAYLVGGSVRDLIRGVVPLDYDIAVQDEPERYAAGLAQQLGSRVIRMGKTPFTVFRVVSGTTQVDVVPMNGPNIDADLAARDFTVNALACEITGGRIIDPTGGLRDMQQRTVRMVSPRVFEADSIRLLRAFRMAAVLDFDIDPATARTIGRTADAIQSSAGERVCNELYKILACEGSHRQIVQMARTGLLTAIFPEFNAMQACDQNRHHGLDAFHHTLKAFGDLEGLLAGPSEWLAESGARFVEALPGRTKILLKLAVLLHDIGKPDCRSVDRTGEIHFYGHAGRSAELFLPICRRLRMSNHDCDWIGSIIKHHQRPLDLYLAAGKASGRIPSKAFGRFFRQCGAFAPALLLHALADNLGKGETGRRRGNSKHLFIVELLSTCLEVVQTRRASPLINGHDLIRHFGMKPSPLLGSMLEQVEEAYLAGSIENRDQALEWISKRLRKDG